MTEVRVKLKNGVPTHLVWYSNGEVVGTTPWDFLWISTREKYKPCSFASVNFNDDDIS